MESAHSLQKARVAEVLAAMHVVVRMKRHRTTMTAQRMTTAVVNMLCLDVQMLQLATLMQTQQQTMARAWSWMHVVYVAARALLTALATAMETYWTNVECVVATALLKATATVMETYWTNVECVAVTALLRATATVMETGQLLVTTVMVRA